MARFKRTPRQPDEPAITQEEIEREKAEAIEEERQAALKHAQQAVEDERKAKEQAEKVEADRKKQREAIEAAEEKRRNETANYIASIEANQRDPLILNGDVFNGIDEVVVNGVSFRARA